MRTSWISIDVKGQRVILDVDKHAIVRRVQINARDLRILDPTILGREKVVLNLELHQLQRQLPPDNQTCQGQGEEEEYAGVPNDMDSGEENEYSFEFRALEVALEAICSFLDPHNRELETDT